MDTPVLKTLRSAIGLTAFATLLWQVLHFDWTTVRRSPVILLVFLFFTAVALAPYGLLWLLTQFKYRSTVWRLLEFVLITAPAGLLLTPWRAEMEGWLDFLVPVAQTAVAVVFIALAYWHERRVVRRGSYAPT